jgi:predicted PurR-regulated permease PerM
MKTSWDPAFRYIVMTVVLALLAAALWYIREIFQPLVSAMLIAYFCSPLVNLLKHWTRFSRKTAARLVYLSGLVVMIALPFTILPTLLREIQGFMADFNATLDQLQTVLNQPRQIGNINIYLGEFIPTLRRTLDTGFIPRPDQALLFLETTSRGFLWFLVIAVTTYYLMTDWEQLREWLIGLAPESQQPDVRRLYSDVKDVWMGYLGGQMRLVLVLIIIYSVAWSVIGVPGALLLGILAGFLNLVPEVGPLIAAILATVVALLEGSNFLPISDLWFGALTLGIYLVLNNFKTIYLQPRILGQSVYLHEGVVFIAIIAAIVLQGILGVLIVVPLLASLMVLGRYIRRRLLGLPPFDDPAPDEPKPDSA